MKKFLTVMIVAVTAFISCEKTEQKNDKIQEVTIAELIGKDISADQWYRVTGKISDMQNIENGNFILNDESGEILVTGVNKESWEGHLELRNNLYNFKTSGAKAGDQITIIGIRKNSDGKPAFGGPAYYVSHQTGEGGEVLPPSPSHTANKNGYLINYEIPYCDVDIPEGKAHSSAVNERYGNTKAYIYETKDKGQRIVTHTFSNNGKTHRNYTFLYDYEKKLPMWLAYHMNKGYCGT